jgi:hypothetical protein
VRLNRLKDVGGDIHCTRGFALIDNDSSIGNQDAKESMSFHNESSFAAKETLFTLDNGRAVKWGLGIAGEWQLGIHGMPLFVRTMRDKLKV